MEAPFLWEHDGTFYLFYSGNAYATGFALLRMPSMSAYVMNSDMACLQRSFNRLEFSAVRPL